MDPDIFGVRRYGMFRYGVYNDFFDSLIERLESLDIKDIGTDPPIMGYCRMGYTYFGVRYGLFEDIKKALENAL